MTHDYILFIDKTPITQELRNYFANFQMNILEKPNTDILYALDGNPLAILLDWSLIQDKLALIQEAYRRFSAPLLIMHDAMDEAICIKVLESGADDFILKPLQPRELHARISAIARRITRAPRTQAPQEKIVYKFADWFLYPNSRQIFDTQHKELLLSSGEYDLLIAFVQKPQQILSREFLSQITKHEDLNPFDRRIDVQVSRLRQKIDKKNPEIIKTIRNGGYMLTSTVMVLKESEID